MSSGLAPPLPVCLLRSHYISLRVFSTSACVIIFNEPTAVVVALIVWCMELKRKGVFVMHDQLIVCRKTSIAAIDSVTTTSPSATSLSAALSPFLPCFSFPTGCLGLSFRPPSFSPVFLLIQRRIIAIKGCEILIDLAASVN